MNVPEVTTAASRNVGPQPGPVTVEVDFNGVAGNGLLRFRPERADGPLRSGMFVVAREGETCAPCLVVEAGGRLFLTVVRTVDDVR